ncbi:unnamed protein product [Pleuronectes platessa]|uniref:Uncharacterized protein n=1 Tax=Pleuronectes platessa TaxID=8262 RepID=A0A9N7U6Z0_PLEPL|nr:unnamed protein product [Pleuronectes platessa]
MEDGRQLQTGGDKVVPVNAIGTREPPWRKDRAPSAAFKRRRINFPYPNRPVPPPGPRYLGPQSRTYAAHYREGLEASIKDISGDLTPGWRTAFQVATKRARKNLSRITQEVIDHAEALLTTYENVQALSETEQQPARVTQQTPQRTEQVVAKAPRRNITNDSDDQD